MGEAVFGAIGGGRGARRGFIAGGAQGAIASGACNPADRDHACRRAFPEHYVRVNGYDRSLGRATTALSFIVNRPTVEPEFELDRQEFADRQVKYTLRVRR